MADNTIDSLTIEISSNVSNTSRSISNLCNELKQLDGILQKSIKYFRHFSTSVGIVNTSIQSLNGINFSKLSVAAAELERLSKINLSNLENKKVKIDVEINSADLESKLKYSVQKSLDATKIDASALAKQLSSAFELKGGAASKLQKQIDLLAEQLTASFDGKNFRAGEWSQTLDEIGKTIEKSGSIVKSNLGNYLSGAEQEWQDFYNYFKNKKIYVSDMLKADIGKGEFRELLQQYLGNITVDATKGINLDSVWGELSEKFPTLIPKDTINDADQLITVLENLKKVRDSIKPISIQALSGSDATMASDRVYSSVNELGTQLGASIQRNIVSAMESANGQIPIDVKINEDKIIRDIRNAINKASTLNYDPIKVNLSVDTESIKSNLQAKLNGLDIGDVSDKLKEFSRTLEQLGNINLKDTGINAVVNSVRRLSESLKTDVDISGKVNSLISSLSGLSNLPDVSNGVNRFVSSLAKLANAGSKTEQTASGIANLARQLNKSIKTISRAGEVSESVNMFAQAIAQLANAGNKTGQTAGNLGELAKETKKFFEVMKDAPEISENTIRMTEALGRLAASGGRVSTATNTVSNSFSKLSSIGRGLSSLLGNVANKAKSGINFLVSGFSNLVSSSNGLKSATSNVESFIKTVLGFKALSAVMSKFNQAMQGKGIMELGSDITEVENIVDVAFGSMADKAYEFASTATKQFGLSELAAKNYSGTMMAMLKSSGVAQESAAKMSTTLAGLAGDLASFYNIDTDTAFYKIRSGIAGQVMPLRQLGINLSVANLEAYALSQGITTSYNSMTQAQKVMLRYNYLLSVTGDQQGDFARTAGTWANQVRLLTLNIQSLASVIGQGLIAAILPAVQALNTLMSKLMNAAEAFRNFMYALTGKKMKGSAKGVVNEFAGLDDASMDLSSLEDSGDDASSGLDKASKSAKNLKKSLSLLPFDELNVLTSNLLDATSSGTTKKGTSGLDDLGLGDLSDQLNSALTDEKTPINKWAEKIRKAFLKHDWKGLGKVLADMVNAGLQKLYDVLNWKNVGPKITEFCNAFTEAFNSFIDSIDWDLLGRVIGTGINTLVNTFELLIGPNGIDFVNIGNKLATGLRGMLDEVNWTNLGQVLGSGFMVSWDILNGFVTNMSQANDAGLTGWQQLGTSIANAMNGMFSRISFSDIASTIATGLNGAFQTLLTWTQNFNWQQLVDNISSGINTFISTFDWQQNGQSLNTFISDLLDALVDIAGKTDWESFGEGIGTFLSQIDWATDLQKLGTILLDVLGGIWSGLGETSAGKFVETIIGFGIAAKLLPVVNEIGSVFASDTTVGKITSSVTNAFSGAFGLFKEGGIVYDTFLSASTSLAGALSSLTGLSVPVGVASAGIVAAVAGIGLSITDLWNTSESFRDTVSNAFGKVKDSVSGAFDKIKEAVSPLSESFSNLGSQLYDFYVNSGLKSLVSLFETLAVTIGGTVISTGIDIWGSAFSGLISIFQSGIDIISDVFETINGLFTLDFKKAGEGFVNLASDIVGAFENILGSVWDIGTNIFLGLLDGIKDAAKDIKGWFKDNVVDRIVNTVKNLFGIHSPSTVFAEIGGYLMEGLKSGISDMSQNVIDFFTGIKDDIVGIWDGISSKIKGAWQKITGQTEDDSKTTADNAEKSFNRVSASATENWGNSAEEVKKNVQQMKLDASAELTLMDTNVKDHFQKQYNAMTSKWKEAGDAIVSYIKDTMKANISSEISGISDSIVSTMNGLYDIGWNGIIGMNNGMVAAAGQHLYRNVQSIAQNVANKFRSVLKIHSPSQVFEEIGGFTMEGLVNGIQSTMPKIESTIQDVSNEIQKIQTPSADFISKNISIQEVKSRLSVDTDDFMDDIRKEVMAISSNTFDNNQMIGQAVKNALNGMAIYADGHLIGYLQEENRQHRNRSGYGLFEG